MNNKRIFKRLILIASVLMVAALIVAVQASAKPDSPEKNPIVIFNTETVTRPDLGPPSTNGVVGKNGYKVFDPGAIGIVSITPSGESGDMTIMTVYRSGWTNAWLDFGTWQWHHFGSHTSDSDLWEDEIWVDGFLKVTTDPGWRDACDNHRAGDNSYCGTNFDHILPRTIYAKSDHHFHTDGYVDNNFSTADSA